MKKLAITFKQFREYTNFEMDLLKKQSDKRQAVIDKQKEMVEGYEMALRIPRQHYKHLENLKYEAIMEQRDAIIKKFKKKGIDLSKKGALVQMPDPSLPAA